ncbi:hypothetical protein KL919_001840 [Ogataea angusta]|nr:hypothetical protein KL943_002156 [Ogataea angusta]KAG7861106.1 hypothetical protein KL919_001840 [Ogataea angusta]
MITAYRAIEFFIETEWDYWDEEHGDEVPIANIFHRDIMTSWAVDPFTIILLQLFSKRFGLLLAADTQIYSPPNRKKKNMLKLEMTVT